MTPDEAFRFLTVAMCLIVAYEFRTVTFLRNRVDVLEERVEALEEESRH